MHLGMKFILSKGYREEFESLISGMRWISYAESHPGRRRPNTGSSKGSLRAERGPVYVLPRFWRMVSNVHCGMILTNGGGFGALIRGYLTRRVRIRGYFPILERGVGSVTSPWRS